MSKYEPSHLKMMNTWIVYREFLNRSEEGIFTKEIARKCKISDPTVIKIVDFLKKKEIVTETTSRAENDLPSVGRKPNLLMLNRDKYYSVGILFEGESLTLGIVDLTGKVHNFIQVKGTENIKECLISNIHTLLKVSERSKEDLIGIGLGMPGIYDKNLNQITAPLIGMGERTDFGETINDISKEFGVGVTADNDLNAKAYGEFEANAGFYKDDLIFISLGTGLGAGIIVDGKVRLGKQFIGGEIGYMRFEYNEDSPESGWLENQINLRAIQKEFGVTEKNKENVKAAIEHVSRCLALLINNLIISIDISNVVLDGLVIDLLGDEVIKRTQDKLNAICIRPVEIGNKQTMFPGITGAGLTAGKAWLNKIFENY